MDVVVLAGGRATRFGSDKVGLLLPAVLAGLPDEVEAVVCVGPPRPTARPVRWTREKPLLSGPLAAVAAGVEHTSSPVVVVVGGDMPDVGRAVAALAGAVPGHDVAVLVDADARPQPLASAWQRDYLVRRLAAVQPVAGQPVRVLLEGADVVAVPDGWGAGRDVDVPADLS